jgi:hypothetical protein
MNNVKNVFSIKDLENLSGIKALRIWEKRYDIFAAMRTNSFVCMIWELTKIIKHHVVTRLRL